MSPSTTSSRDSLPRRVFAALRRSRLGRNKVISGLYREMVIRLHGSNEVRIGEFTVTFDPRDRYIPGKLIVDGGYEKKEIALLCSLIKPGDLVLDIGANIGLYTLPMSRAVGDTGTVIAFEPDPDNARILKHNVRANQCTNVRVVTCALGNQDGEVDLFQRNENRGNLSFADLARTGRSVKVPVRRGAAVLHELAVGTPAVAKIDVEGAEPLVLEGLGCHPRCVQLEFVPALLRALGFDPLEFLQHLDSDGYTIASIDRDTAELRATSNESLIEMADTTGLVYNLMLIRQ